jgi:hypothetical protein
MEGTKFTNFSSTSMQKAFQSAVSNPLTVKFGWTVKYQVLGWCSLAGVICEIPRTPIQPKATAKTRIVLPILSLRAGRQLSGDGAVVYFTIRRTDGEPIPKAAVAYMNATDESAPDNYLQLSVRILRGLGAPVDSVYWFSAPRFCAVEGAGSCNVTGVLSGLRSSVFDLSSIWKAGPTFDMSRDR